MDQDVTWYGARPQPSRLCVRWGPSLRPPKRAEPPPQFFFTHSYYGQTAGMDVGLIPGDFMLDGDPVPSPQKGGAHPPQKGRSPTNFRPIFILANRLDGSRR